ncbi:type IV pilus assembly protein PilB [Bacillus mesophilus]|uniref:Flp pilus assembly complex ATPase component n=1 Tax=Bacillus mesophilus TaxID=1808955 RepID=A0A6M0QBB4_9BACI|nr:ATPase, T2SS/T4P/T4SS family [Bacillus mesophilus]MBM7662321.1 type IV pilus assembly protein PilB [Bacillus mesophilus]NEY73049.1 Flp pilus assembly complex ATPase component [Bacillus mesophilus]
MNQKKRKRIGDLLIEANVITEEQLMDALLEQKRSGQRLGDQLVLMNIVDEDTIIQVLEYQLGIKKVNLHEVEIDRKLVSIISEDLARKYQVLPLRKVNDNLLVAMVDPLDYYAIDDLRLSTGFQIEPAIAKRNEIQVALNRYYGMQKSIDKMLEDMPLNEDDEGFLEAQQADDSPVAKMVNQLLGQAIQVGASDVHIDPHENETLIRLRVDGVLRTERTLPKNMNNVLVSRIKIMSKLNIAEKRLPQDGRFKMDVDLRNIDLRVSILPTVYGEKVVMRLLDTGNVTLGIEKLGFSKQNEINFRKMINSAYGIILVTGPTGSGKSTTLYTALQNLNTDDVNIITVEDPVEYQIKGINQVQVRSNIGMTFAAGLRSILRQDPDIIMLGEIRDTETAEISLRAALTGHLVLSTLHTNDSVSAISRLIDMGVEPFLVSSAVVGVVAQRLVRRVCKNCATPYVPTEEEQQLFYGRGLNTERLSKGKGCSTCNNTGYKGRLAIHETLLVDDEMRNMITQKNQDSVYRNYVSGKGFKSMFEDGLMKAAQGMTSLDEIYRVTVE